jgi:hypothetical protein
VALIESYRVIRFHASSPGFGERRVVERVLDEIVDGAFQIQHGLADVNQFGRAALAQDVRA